jgi:hypothetical protein
MSIQRVRAIKELILFNDAIFERLHFRYPLEFLEKAYVYGEKIGAVYVAGFILNPYHTSFMDFRVLKQIPNEHYYRVIEKLMASPIVESSRHDLWEFTGYFISPYFNDKKLKSILFTLKMILISILKGKYFFISFDRKNQSLGEYYGHGYPLVIYRGIVTYQVLDQFNNIEIHEGNEQVEVIDRMGLIRIFKWRTIKEIKRWLQML